MPQKMIFIVNSARLLLKSNVFIMLSKRKEMNSIRKLFSNKTCRFIFFLLPISGLYACQSHTPDTRFENEKAIAIIRGGFNSKGELIPNDEIKSALLTLKRSGGLSEDAMPLVRKIVITAPNSFDYKYRDLPEVAADVLVAGGYKKELLNILQKNKFPSGVIAALALSKVKNQETIQLILDNIDKISQGTVAVFHSDGRKRDGFDL